MPVETTDAVTGFGGVSVLPSLFEPEDPLVMLGLDEKDIVSSVHNLLITPGGRQAALCLTGSSARVFLDILQGIMDLDFISHHLRITCHVCMRKLSEKSGILPDSLFLNNAGRLGEYPVSGGGFADIWQGIYRGQTVALKVLRVFAVNTVRMRLQKEFCREALLWRQLKHPNIAPFLGVCIDLFPPHMCMVSPWMANGNILDYLNQNPNLDRQELLHGIAKGLHYLHFSQPKIIHGDVRGANILVNDDHQPVLADFGLTTVADSQAIVTGTTSGSNPRGSAKWMAPELFDPSMFDEGGISRRRTASDVYAFACLSYEIYSRKPPFHNLNDAAVMFQVIKGKRPPKPTEGVPIPQHLWQLMDMCWAHNPLDRPDMTSVVAHLVDGIKLGTRAESKRIVSPVKARHENVDHFGLPEWVSTDSPSPTNNLIKDLDMGTTNDECYAQEIKSLVVAELPRDTIHVKVSYPAILLEGHEAGVLCAAWNPTYPNLLATGSRDGTVRIWSWKDIKADVHSQGPLGRFDSPPRIDFPISHYSRPRHAVLRHPYKSSQLEIRSLDWNADGTLLAVGTYDHFLHIWQASGELYMTQTRHPGPVTSVRFSEAGKWLLSASFDGTICVWDVAKKKHQMQFNIYTRCLDVDWLDENTFAICSADGIINIISLLSSRVIRTFVEHTDEVNQVKFNKQKTILASCSDDGTARIWLSHAWSNSDGTVASASPSMDEAELITRHPAEFVLTGHANVVSTISWCSTEGGVIETLLATSSFDKTARLWDASEGTCLRVFAGHTKPLFSVRFSPDGRFIATGGEDGYMYIYHLATGNKVWRWPTIELGTEPIYEINWQKAGGRQLAICMKSRMVCVVDTDVIFVPSSARLHESAPTGVGTYGHENQRSSDGIEPRNPGKSVVS